MNFQISRFILVSTALFLFAGQSCNDIQLDDLSNEQVILIGPVNDFSTSSTNQTFWWETLDKTVDYYRVEVVSPSFDQPEVLVVDEAVDEGNTYTVQLSTGSYEWSVRAVNEESQSKRSIRSLTITTDTTFDLSNQIVSLVAPEDNEYTNSLSIEFLWSAVAGAAYYRLQVAQPNFDNSSFVLLDESLSSDNYTAVLEEGDYQWRVRAENNSSLSPYTYHEFTIDNTAPSAPTLLAPSSGDTISLPNMLEWISDPSAAHDSIFLYQGSLDGQLLAKDQSMGESFVLPSTLPLDTTYYWQLRSFDLAGNQSVLSESASFYLKE